MRNNKDPNRIDSDQVTVKIPIGSKQFSIVQLKSLKMDSIECENNFPNQLSRVNVILTHWALKGLELRQKEDKTFLLLYSIVIMGLYSDMTDLETILKEEKS